MTMQLAIVLIIAAGVLNGLLLAWAVARAADDIEPIDDGRAFGGDEEK